jgi:undecaprenyl-diphosphatase
VAAALGLALAATRVLMGGRLLTVALPTTAALVLLGAVQGATEFLPVSSHGHLVLLERWLALPQGDALTRDVLLHLGTLAAVTLFCRHELLAMLRPGSAGAWRVVGVCTLITGASGLALEDLVESALSSPTWIAIGLFVNALLLGLLAPRGDERQRRSLADGTWTDGLVLGLLQSLALVPSISRSGATIVAALWLGYTRRDAVRAAFLVSIPAVGGAVALQAARVGGLSAFAAPGLGPGLLAAFVVGLLALRFLASHVDAGSLRGFAAYCLALGAAVILLA